MKDNPWSHLCACNVVDVSVVHLGAAVVVHVNQFVEYRLAAVLSDILANYYLDKHTYILKSSYKNGNENG